MEDKGYMSERTHGCVDCSEIVPRVVPLRKGHIYGMICTSAEQMNKNYFIDPKEKIKGVQKVCEYTFACKGNFVFTCYPDIEKVLDFKAFLMEQVFEQAMEQNKIWRSYETGQACAFAFRKDCLC